MVTSLLVVAFGLTLLVSACPDWLADIALSASAGLGLGVFIICMLLLTPNVKDEPCALARGYPKTSVIDRNVYCWI